MKTIFALIFVLFSSTAFSAVWEGGLRNISAIRVDGAGVNVAFDPAPANCGGGAYYGMHVQLKTSHPNYQATASALLAVKAADNPITGLWLSNESIGACSSTNGMLTLDAFQY